MIERFNYSSQALDATKKYSTFPDKIWLRHQDWCRKMLHQAIKFQIPEDGKVINSIWDIDPQIIPTVKMPFPCVAIETNSTIRGITKIVTLAVDLNMCEELQELITHSADYSIEIDIIDAIKKREGAYITSFVFTKPYGWTLNIFGLIIPFGVSGVKSAKEEANFRILPVPPQTAHTKELHDVLGDQESIMDHVSKSMEVELNSFFNVSICSMCENIEQVSLKAPILLSAKRIKVGKAPFYETKLLVISERSRSAQRQDQEAPSRGSPRLHLRRGHIRRLPSGALTWVKHAIVGDKSKGLIIKDYAVR